MHWEKWITLKSSDGVELEVEEPVVFESPALKNYINENNLSEDQGTQVGINYETLRRVMDYCKRLALERRCCDDIIPEKLVKRLGAPFVKLDLVNLFHLIHAAHELKIKSLMDLACQAYGDMITKNGVDGTSREFEFAEAAAREAELERQKLDVTESSSEGSIHGHTSEGFKVMSKQGDRHHQYLRLGLDVRPRLSIIPKDICHRLSFCFHEKERLENCLIHISSPDVGSTVKGIRALCDLITMEPRLLDHVSGIGEVLEHLFNSSDPSVKIQAALVLPRLKCPNLVGEIINVLKNLFLTGHTLHRCEVMRTLTFLAVDHPSTHQTILDSDILEVLRTSFHKLRLEEYKVIIQCANFLSAFCCRNPKLPEKKKELVLDIVKSLFKSIDIEGVMPAVCCAFYHLSYQQDMPVEEIVVRKLGWLASNRYPWIVIPALMVVGNIVRYGQDQQIQSMITKVMLTRLRRLLDNDSKLVQTEACWIISNITATSKIEISSSHSVLPRLCDFLKDEESDVQMDAAWSIFNIFTHDHTKIKWPARRSLGFSTFVTKKRSGLGFSSFTTKKKQKTMVKKLGTELQKETEDLW